MLSTELINRMVRTKAKSLREDYDVLVKPGKLRWIKRKSYKTKLKYIREFLKCYRKHLESESEDCKFYMAGYTYLLYTQSDMDRRYLSTAVSLVGIALATVACLTVVFLTK